MKTYKSHKVINAKPMNRGDYNAYRGWTIPADEDPNDEGYLVIYEKDTEDHYESWSPKKQFDEGYSEVTNVVSINGENNGGTWQERVDKELDELLAKAQALYMYMQSPKRAEISLGQLDLMMEQFKVMTEYAMILEARLDLDKEAE